MNYSSYSEFAIKRKELYEGKVTKIPCPECSGGYINIGVQGVQTR